MPVTITRAQRDAIYEMVISHVSGIGDLWLCVARRDVTDARQLGRQFAEDLRLLEDLGWSEAIDQDTVTLTMPPGELTRALARMRKHAAGALGTYVSRPKADEGIAQRNLAASEALEEILSRLAEPASTPWTWPCGRRPTRQRGGVVKALASEAELTGAEIATATGLSSRRPEPASWSAFAGGRA